jgi:Rgg/GadR/MutR family transcriptional activator
LKIGEALKSYRKQKKLTQKEFIRDVLSESYYSKVENNQHRITAEDLFSLLSINNISIQEFSLHLNIGKQSSLKNLQNKMYLMTFNNQRDELDHLVTQALQDPKLTDDEKKLFLILVDVTKQDNIYSDVMLSTENKNFLKEKILTDENWSNNSLTLYANTLHAYDFEDNLTFIQLLLNERTLSQFTEPQSKRSLIFATILLNFVSLCIDQKELALTQKPLQILNAMPKTPEYTFYRLLTVFFQELIQQMTGNQTSSEKIETIIQSFNYIGRTDFAQNLQLVFEEHERSTL